MTPDTEINRLFAASLAATPKPEKPMPYDTPDLGNPDQERSSGVIDFNEVTAGDRATVAHIRKWQEKRDRNATPRTGGDEPEAA